MFTTWKIDGLEPLSFGDGRPFSADAGSLERKSLLLPFPSTLYGALAPHLSAPAPGGAANQAMELQGPLLACDGQMLFPLPLDAIPLDKDGSQYLLPLRPRDDLKDCCDLPDGVAEVLSADLNAVEDQGYKRQKEASQHFVRVEDMVSWLTYGGECPQGITKVLTPEEERRFGVAIDLDSQTAARGMLYSVSGHRFGPTARSKDATISHEWSRYSLVVRTKTENNQPLPEQKCVHLGAENRHAVLTRVHQEANQHERRMNPEACEAGGPGDFACPAEVREALKKSGGRVRLTLATPAQFSEGWKPEWLTSTCPFVNIEFKLVAAAVGRRIAVSGWGVSGKSWGPKPVVWLAPAGSTYYLEAEKWTEESASRLADSWLHPVSHDSRFRRRGFGLALWGIW